MQGGAGVVGDGKQEAQFLGAGPPPGGVQRPQDPPGGPGGQRHYYAHLDRYPDLTAGEWVNSGDVVGYVGDSGNAKGTPTHLHYGIYTAAGAINPYPLLAAGRK